MNDLVHGEGKVCKIYSYINPNKVACAPIKVKSVGAYLPSLTGVFTVRMEVAYLDPEPLKCQTKIAADNILIFNFNLSKKIRLNFSCESSA